MLVLFLESFLKSWRCLTEVELAEAIGAFSLVFSLITCLLFLLTNTDGFTVEEVLEAHHLFLIH
ncbi:hypothetical protein BT63DRAFT_428031 [Microthyrium microscopicum]|uniref:Uncharacterized protein n=1 Tax=Microthyrium microscopicum TaxID=703497 RepID=A0A6A6U551_9PEZI|nr:hypothetical protein BT63DRAFT_428031 [Microthyrium microscopicum]